MPGRFTIGAVLALCLLGSKASYAQYDSGASSNDSPYVYGQTRVYGDPNPVTANYPVRNWDQTYSYGDARSPDLQPMLPNYGPGPDGIVTEEIPRHWGFGEETPFDAFLKDVVRNSWIRIEYLSVDTREPGSALLGAPIQGVANPRDPFAITFQGTNDGAAGQEMARVADLGAIGLEDRNGIRGTIGIPLTFGSIEANIFGTEKTSTSVAAADLPGSPFQLSRVFVATSTFINQDPSNPTPGLNLFLYDQSFVSTFTTQLFGTEANFIMDPHVPGEGFHFRPMFGIRYLNVKEELQQVGVFSDFGLVTPVTSTINSKSRNSIIAPQFGLRSELVHQYFTFGIDTKIGFGVNTYEAVVQTQTLRGNGDPTVTTRQKDSQFSPVGEFQVFLRVPVNENFSLYGGFTYLIAAKINRPHESIFYNDNGASNPPAVVVNAGFSNFSYKVWTIGGEYKFR